MNGWIVAKGENWEEYANRRLVEEAENIGMNVSLHDPKDLDLCVTERGEGALSSHGQMVPLPDFVLPRTGSGTIYYHLALLRHLECLGVPVINTAEAIAKARDKLHTLQLLIYHGLPIPKTILAKFPLDLQCIDSYLEYPVIIKTVVGSRGRGILLCESPTEVSDVMEMLEVSSRQDVYYIIQEFVLSSRGQDLRAIVVGGRVLGAMMRKASEHDFRANISRGAAGEPFELTPQIEWLATEATRVLGLDIGGVDLLFDGQTYKICEVNSAPGFEGFEEATAVNVPRQVYDYITIRLDAG